MDRKFDRPIIKTKEVYRVMQVFMKKVCLLKKKSKNKELAMDAGVDKAAKLFR